MELPDLRHIRHYMKIPEIFHSFQAEGPFERCLICERYLLKDGVQYLIEKAYKKEEVIIECATCMDCCINMREELSRESLQRIDSYFDEHVDLLMRRRKLIRTSSDRLEPWIDKCVITGRDRSEQENFQVYAQCDGKDLLFSYLPYMISGAAINQMYKLLSKKTRDHLDGFVDEYFGLPSEFLDLPEDKPLLLV
jgi:hypothetical protein